MVPYAQTIEIYRGDYYSQMLRLRQRVWNPILKNGQGDWAPGPYRDLTGWSGIFQIRTQPDQISPAGVGTVTIMDQVQTVGGVTYSIPGTVTQNLEPDPNYAPPGEDPGNFLWGWMYYHVKLIDPSGNDYTFLAGTVKLVKGIVSNG
jgi:hypothetical protein